jgi:hypothetical protein
MTFPPRIIVYLIIKYRTRKGEPLNTGDCLIEVTTYVGLTVVIQCSSKYDLQPDKY